MSEITITNLNNIISDYKKKLKDCEEKNIGLESRARSLEKDLKEARKRK